MYVDKSTDKYIKRWENKCRYFMHPLQKMNVIFIDRRAIIIKGKQKDKSLNKKTTYCILLRFIVSS